MTISTKKPGRITAWLIWAVAVCFVIYKFQTQSSYAILNTNIAESLALTLTQVGQLGAAYSITYAIMTILVGGLLDYYGARKVLLLGIFIVVTGALAFSLSNNWYSILASQCLLGVGGAVGFPLLAYVTRHWFEADKFGLVFGFAQTIAATTNTIGQALVGYLILILPWQGIKLLEAFVGLVLLIAAILIVKETGTEHANSRETNSTVSFWSALYNDSRVLFKKTIFWQTIIISGISFGTTLSIGVVWGVRILQSKGFDLTTAGNINSVMWVGLGVGALLIHVLADLIKSYKITASIFLACHALTLLFVILHDELTAFLATLAFVMIGFFTGVSTLCYTMTTKFSSKNLSGTAFGYLTCITFLITSVLIPVPGFMIESALMNISIDNSMTIYPLTIFFALLVSLTQKETYSMPSN